MPLGLHYTEIELEMGEHVGMIYSGGTRRDRGVSR